MLRQNRSCAVLEPEHTKGTTVNPALIIALVEGGIALLESMAAKGEVTPEKVAEIKAKAKASESAWDAAVEKAKDHP